ncbi:hypothetical protein IR010_19905, partial [Flavobacterium sp. MR2016-29]|uniref:DUF5977 domain-containing protein n=1 Tax=Flavobacterium sp. MR2016-29 TaxID=2783795 RepID=UPI0019DF324A
MKNIFLTIFLFQFILVMSQNAKENYFPPTPEANSLIKYVDVPVNYSTGVTNYSIPVHTIKLKDLVIPITLTYQSSGLKPSEVAGNTGLGWELNVGGKITQNVVKQNDIDVPGPGNPIWNLPNNRDFKLPMPASDIYWTVPVYSTAQLDSIKGAGTDYNMFSQIDDYNLETQPDIFYYSTPNKSGKFFFGNNFETKQIPFGKEKIIFINRTFEITDVDGVKYIYDVVVENINSTETTCLKFPDLNGTSRNNSYTYYLSKIITPNNETVDFIYDTVKYNLANDKEYTRYYHSFFGGGEKVTLYSSEITSKVLSKIKVNQDYEIEFLNSKYRKDIKGSVQATAPKTLDDIKIKYKNEIQTYHFDYGYFGINESEYDPNTFEGILLNEDSGYRLKLKSFQKTGENPYVFLYNDEEAVQRYTACLDHWGYYSNSCTRYTMNSLFSDLGSTKEPSLEKTKTNILRNIMLPTKGEVQFNYELNTCSDCAINYTSYDWIPYSAYANDDDNFSGELLSHVTEFTVPESSITVPYVNFNLYSSGEATTTNYAIAQLYDDQDHLVNFELTGTTGNNFKPFKGDPLQKGKKYKLVLNCYDTMENENKYVSITFLTAANNVSEIPSVGGLRIKNIKTNDAGNITSDRSFDYNDDGQSSGILYEKPFYYDEYSYFRAYNPNSEDNINGYGLISYAVQYSRIPSDLFGFNGYHIFYKKVTEKNNDISNPLNNIKVEKYFTFYDDLAYGDQTYFSKISYGWKRGLPSQINEFNANDILRKTTFSYSFLDTPIGSNISHYEPGFHLSNPTFPNEYHKRSIDLSVYRRSLSRYNIYQYKSSKLISAWYYMDKKTTEEYFDGKVLKTEEDFKYDNSVHAQLTSHSTKNSKGETIETKYAYPDDLISEPMMAELKAANRISAPIVTEQYNAGTLISKSKTVFAKDPTTSNLLVPKEIYSAKFPNDFPDIQNVGKLEKKITYDQYDEKGNVLQYTKESGISVSIIWGYYKTLPIAKIENASYGLIPSSTITSLQNLSNMDDDNCMSSDCTEQLLRNGLNALRTSFYGSFITIYTYNPLSGVTSVTDPKGICSYYEYDLFGRLKFVKDKDLNVLQKYCYNYKGQHVDCSDNTSTSVFLYKSVARSGQFIKDNCTSGGTGSSVSYTQPAGACTSTISQDDADSHGLDKFNADGKAYANTNGICTFYSAPLSGSFAKMNCPPGGNGSNVIYNQSAGAAFSNNSQAEADSNGLAKFNADGLAYANANGYCTFYSAPLSSSFTKTNCASGGSGSSVPYSQAYGAVQSTVSQAQADSDGLAKFNTDGLAYANANGYCTFYSAPLSSSFT